MKKLNLEGVIICKNHDSAEAVASRLRTQGFWCNAEGDSIKIRTLGVSELYEEAFWSVLDATANLVVSHRIKVAEQSA